MGHRCPGEGSFVLFVPVVDSVGSPARRPRPPSRPLSISKNSEMKTATFGAMRGLIEDR